MLVSAGVLRQMLIEIVLSGCVDLLKINIHALTGVVVERASLYLRLQDTGTLKQYFNEELTGRRTELKMLIFTQIIILLCFKTAPKQLLIIY